LAVNTVGFCSAEGQKGRTKMVSSHLCVNMVKRKPKAILMVDVSWDFMAYSNSNAKNCQFRVVFTPFRT